MEIVKPGEELGTEEEFLNGFGTYIEQEKILSLLLGEKRIEDRKVNVEKEFSYKKLHRGVIVFGKIENVSDQTALATILPIEKGYPKTNDYAALHVSKVRQGFVKSLKDEVKIGDIIKAVIVEYDPKKGQIGLAIDKPNLGIVLAFCTKCKIPLERKGDMLSCSKCEREEKRAISNDYRNLSV